MRKLLLSAAAVFILLLVLFAPACGKRTTARQRGAERRGTEITTPQNPAQNAPPAQDAAPKNTTPYTDAAEKAMQALDGAVKQNENATEKNNGAAEQDGSAAKKTAEENLHIYHKRQLTDKETAWRAERTKGEVLDALARMDVSVAALNKIEVLQMLDDESAASLGVGGTLVSAYEFKEALDLPSTLIGEIKNEDGAYVFYGKGKN